MMQVGRRFQTFNQAIGFYSNALDALRQHDFDLRLLDDLRAPLRLQLWPSGAFRPASGRRSRSTYILEFAPRGPTGCRVHNGADEDAQR